MNEALLIDECLTVELVSVANELGMAAHHVAHIGLSGKPDHQVFKVVEVEGYIFVTNNRDDFLTLVQNVNLHAGLIVILPNCPREKQMELFRAALRYVQELGNLINRVLEIDGSGKIEVYPLPD
jgi:predicted nuclease of predicted toxin-antitoxin system